MASIEFAFFGVRMAEVNDRPFIFPTVAHVFGIGDTGEVHLNVVEVRTTRHAVRHHRRREHLVLREMDRTRLLPVAR